MPALRRAVEEHISVLSNLPVIGLRETSVRMFPLFKPEGKRTS